MSPEPTRRIVHRVVRRSVSEKVWDQRVATGEMKCERCEEHPESDELFIVFIADAQHARNPKCGPMRW